jgi:hypothetical protein
MPYHTDEEQSGDKLKKKFNKLAKVKMGTGNPAIPPDVCEAEDICCLIIEKSAGVTGSKEVPFAVEDTDEEAEDVDFQSAINVTVYDVVNDSPQDNEGAIVGPARNREAIGMPRAGINGVSGHGETPSRGNSMTSSVFYFCVIEK